MDALHVVIYQLTLSCHSAASYIYVDQGLDMVSSFPRQWVFLNRPGCNNVDMFTNVMERLLGNQHSLQISQGKDGDHHYTDQREYRR